MADLAVSHSKALNFEPDNLQQHATSEEQVELQSLNPNGESAPIEEPQYDVKPTTGTELLDKGYMQYGYDSCSSRF